MIGGFRAARAIPRSQCGSPNWDRFLRPAGLHPRQRLAHNRAYCSEDDERHDAHADAAQAALKAVLGRRWRLGVLLFKVPAAEAADPGIDLHRLGALRTSLPVFHPIPPT